MQLTKLTIAKHFTFEASHILPGEEVYGKCSRHHGHSYKLLVEIEGTVNEFGWITNFSEVKQFVNESVINRVDHFHLNDIIPSIPTAENIVLWIAAQLVDAFKGKPYSLTSLTLYETATSYAKVSV